LTWRRFKLGLASDEIPAQKWHYHTKERAAASLDRIVVIIQVSPDKEQIDNIRHIYPSTNYSLSKITLSSGMQASCPNQYLSPGGMGPLPLSGESKRFNFFALT